MKCPLGISSFLKEISGLSILLFSSISLHCLLAKALLPFLALLWNSAFSWVYLSPSPFPFASLFSSVCKISTPQISTLPSYISFPWGWFWSPPPVQCYALQVNSLPAEPQGKPKNIGVSSLSLLHWIFLTQESHWGLQHYRQILYQLSYQGSPDSFSIYVLSIYGDILFFCTVW